MSLLLGHGLLRLLVVEGAWLEQALALRRLRRERRRRLSLLLLSLVQGCVCWAGWHLGCCCAERFLLLGWVACFLRGVLLLNRFFTLFNRLFHNRLLQCLVLIDLWFEQLLFWLAISSGVLFRPHHGFIVLFRPQTPLLKLLLVQALGTLNYLIGCLFSDDLLGWLHYLFDWLNALTTSLQILLSRFDLWDELGLLRNATWHTVNLRLWHSATRGASELQLTFD